MIYVSLHNISKVKAYSVNNTDWIELYDKAANNVTIFGLSPEVNRTIEQLILNQVSPLPEINTKLEHVATAPTATEAFERIIALREYFAGLCDTMINVVAMQEGAEM